MINVKRIIAIALLLFAGFWWFNGRSILTNESEGRPSDILTQFK